MEQYREQQAKSRGDEGRAFAVQLVRGRFQRAAGVVFAALILAVGGTCIAAAQNVGHQPRPFQQAVRCQRQPKHQEHRRNDCLQPIHMSIDSWFHQEFKEIYMVCVWLSPLLIAWILSRGFFGGGHPAGGISSWRRPSFKTKSTPTPFPSIIGRESRRPSDDEEATDSITT